MPAKVPILSPSGNVSVPLQRSLGTCQGSNIGLGKFPTGKEMTCSGWYSSRDRWTRVVVLALCWGTLKNNITPLEVGTAPSLGLRTDFARVADILGHVNQSSCQIC